MTQDRGNNLTHGQKTQLAGVGPTRVNAMLPAWPAFDPALNENMSVAAPQLVNASVPLPTGAVVGIGGD